MAEPWCRWHWPSDESKTGNFCTAHMNEGVVPDCPYRTLAEMESDDTDYKCDYAPKERTDG